MQINGQQINVPRAVDPGFIESGSGYGPRITSESGCRSRVLKTNKTEENIAAEKEKNTAENFNFFISFFDQK
jgi:hypothetical protein